MWVHLLGDWNNALEYCAKVQAEAERCFITASSAGSIPKDNEHLKLHEVYTTLVDVCLSPLEPIALGIILPGSGNSFCSTHLMGLYSKMQTQTFFLRFRIST